MFHVTPFNSITGYFQTAIYRGKNLPRKYLRKLAVSLFQRKTYTPKQHFVSGKNIKFLINQIEYPFRTSRLLIMGCHGGFSLDEATRRSWYNPESILKDLRLGMVFVDVGCGDGFFSILAAKKVGVTGKVYSVDIDASAIEKLKQKTSAEGLKNIAAKVGKAEDTVFCEGCADFVFYSIDLHDFSEPAKVLKMLNK